MAAAGAMAQQSPFTIVWDTYRTEFPLLALVDVRHRRLPFLDAVDQRLHEARLPGNADVQPGALVTVRLPPDKIRIFPHVPEPA